MPKDSPRDDSSTPVAIRIYNLLSLLVPATDDGVGTDNCSVQNAIYLAQFTAGEWLGAILGTNLWH